MSNIWSDSFSTIREPFLGEKKEEDEVLKKKSKKDKDDEDDNGDTADKDYDGDGKLESGKDEYFGSKDKAIKKAMKMNKEERQLHSSSSKNDKVDTKKGIRNIINTKPTVSEEVDAWIAELLDDGYDLSDYTLEDMYEIYNEAYKGGPEFGMKYSKPKPPSGKVKPESEKGGYGGDEKFTKPDDKIEKPGTTVPPFKKGGYGRIMSNIPHGIGAHRDKTASRITTITGKDPGAPTSQKMRAPDKKKNLEVIRKKPQSENFELWLGSLLDEGYDLSEFTIESIFEVYQNLKLDEADTYGMPPMGDVERQKADPMTVAKAKAAKAKVSKERADVQVAQQAQRLKVNSAESVSFYVSNRFSVFEEVCNSKKSKVKVANSLLKSLKDK